MSSFSRRHKLVLDVLLERKVVRCKKMILVHGLTPSTNRINHGLVFLLLCSLLQNRYFQVLLKDSNLIQEFIFQQGIFFVAFLPSPFIIFDFVCFYSCVWTTILLVSFFNHALPLCCFLTFVKLSCWLVDFTSFHFASSEFFSSVIFCLNCAGHGISLAVVHLRQSDAFASDIWLDWNGLKLSCRIGQHLLANVIFCWLYPSLSHHISQASLERKTLGLVRILNKCRWGSVIVDTGCVVECSAFNSFEPATAWNASVVAFIAHPFDA